jgi:hypothetical protein
MAGGACCPSGGECCADFGDGTISCSTSTTFCAGAGLVLKRTTVVVTMVKADVVLVITAVTEVFLSFDWCDLHFLIQPFRLSCDTKVDSPNFDTGEEQWLQEVQPKEHFHRSIRQHRKFRY